jgi:hypothetical protein
MRHKKLFAFWFFGLAELGASCVGHIGDTTANLEVSKIATALRAHIAFAFEGRGQQSIKAFANAGAPSTSIAKFGCASGA